MDNRSKELQSEYALRFKDLDEYRDNVWKVLCSDFFSRYIDRSATVLDLGAGWGEFTRNIVVQKKFAMDLNPDCGIRLPEDVSLLNQDCSSDWPLDANSLDVVFTSNFFEHLPNKQLIDQTLDEALRCLKPGGKIICLGPNIKYVPGAYWDYWDHFIPITHESMAEALALRGFNVKEKIDRFLPYSMSNGKQSPLVFVKVYLKIKIAWKFLGKQFLVVAEKP
jgi:SAM-dependent methyltransferase